MKQNLFAIGETVYHRVATNLNLSISIIAARFFILGIREEGNRTIYSCRMVYYKDFCLHVDRVPIDMDEIELVSEETYNKAAKDRSAQAAALLEAYVTKGRNQNDQTPIMVPVKRETV